MTESDAIERLDDASPIVTGSSVRSGRWYANVYLAHDVRRDRKLAL